MRFCMVTTFYPPYHFGGDAVYVYRLVCELARAGHQVDVVHCVDAYRAVRGSSAPNGKPLPHPEGVRIISLESRWGLLPPLLTHQTGHPVLKAGQLRRILEKGGYDVIHFHNVSLIGPATFQYGKAIKLYTMHEHWLVCPLSVLWKFDRKPCDKPECLRCCLHARRPPQLWRRLPLLQRWASNIDAFIAPSEFTIRMHEASGWRFNRPVCVIPYFVPRTECSEKPLNVHPRPFFLYVGRLEKLKGVAVLLDVFAQYRHCDLLIIGDGTQRAELEKQAKELRHVWFLGHMDPQRVLHYHRSAIATIVPSLGYETLGCVVIEAFSQKTPVIVHRLGPLPELVEMSRGGLTYGSRDELVQALELLRTQPALRYELGTNAYEAYRQYWTPEAHILKYFELIREIQQQKAEAYADVHTH